MDRIKAIPIYQKCTYHYPDPKNPEEKECRNCKGTGKYKDGYYQIFTMPNGTKICFTTDTLK